MSQDKYFSYCPDCGFETHETSEKAQDSANDCISHHLDESWNEDVEQVGWGEIKQVATKNNVRPSDDPMFDYCCDYDLMNIGGAE